MIDVGPENNDGRSPDEPPVKPRERLRPTGDLIAKLKHDLRRRSWTESFRTLIEYLMELDHQSLQRPGRLAILICGMLGIVNEQPAGERDYLGWRLSCPHH